jgi:hypothetical protein
MDNEKLIELARELGVTALGVIAFLKTISFFFLVIITLISLATTH